MAMNQRELFLPEQAASGPVAAARRHLRELAAHDWLVFVFLVILLGAAFSAQPGEMRETAIRQMGALLTFLVATLVVVRGGLLKHRFWAPLLYRLAIYGTVQLSYFFLTGLLPIVNTSTLDSELYQLDMTLFGLEPAMVMDSWVNSVTTEWFAFFYFSYFFILALHVIPILMFSRSRRLLGEFAFGMLTVFCVGHIVYMLVPGYGPYKAMATHFEHAFPSGMWLDMVLKAVASGGAQMDIFPSLHTACPTFIALFAYRHRERLPFRYSWRVTVFFAVNIIIATMFLRWHYLIDVVAGLILASMAYVLSVRVTSWEAQRRAALGTPGWPLFGESAR
ncbi:MAG: phosphatase PAP2 family protein [Polyangiaceae bacterium]